MREVAGTGLSPRRFIPLDWLGFAFSHRISYRSNSRRHRAQGGTQWGGCSRWEKINSLKLSPLLYVCVEVRKPFLAFNLFLTIL